MKIENKIYISRSAMTSIDCRKVLRAIGSNRNNSDKINQDFNDKIFYKSQLREPKEFEKISSFNEYKKNNVSFYFLSLKTEYLNKYILEKFKKSFCNNLSLLNTLKNSLSEFDFDKKSIVFASTMSLINQFLSFLDKDTIPSKFEFNKFEIDRKKLEIINETNNSRNISAKAVKCISNCLQVLKTLIFEYKFINIYKEMAIDACYLTLGKCNVYNLTLVSHVDCTENDDNIPDYKNKKDFCNHVKSKATSVSGFIDNFSSLYNYIDLNEFFELKEKIFNGISNNKNNHTISDINRFCFSRFSISYKSLNSYLITGNEQLLTSLKTYYNVFSAYLTFYRSYGVGVVYDDVVSQLELDSFNRISLGKQKDRKIIENLENNECINYFIDQTTHVYSVAQAFTQDLSTDELEIKKKYSTFVKEKLINPKVTIFEDFRKICLTQKINNHEYRYYANELGLTLLSNIIYYTMCNSVYFDLQTYVENIENKKSKISRLFYIHEAEKRFANAESIYKSNSIYSKLDKENISDIVSNNLNINKHIKLNDDLTKHFWQEANTSNGKYGTILSFLSTVTTLVSTITLAVLSILCFVNYKIYNSDTISKISYVSILLLLLILIISLICKAKKSK